jgi:hypothetical protein
MQSYLYTQYPENSTQNTPAIPMAVQSQSDTFTNNLISDLGLASLSAAFLAPAIIPLAGLPIGAAIAAETIFGSTGAGIELLYPQAYQQVSNYIPTIPAFSVLLVLLGMTSLTAGAYIDYYMKNKKRRQ